MQGQLHCLRHPHLSPVLGRHPILLEVRHHMLNPYLGIPGCLPTISTWILRGLLTIHNGSLLKLCTHEGGCAVKWQNFQNLALAIYITIIVYHCTAFSLSSKVEAEKMGTLFPLHSWHVIGLPSCSHQGMARGAPPRRGRQGSREHASAAGKWSAQCVFARSQWMRTW